MSKSFLLLLFLFCGGFVSGQFFQTPAYPGNEFRNPLDIPISLAANFGELRENHYHMGLDIRTAHRENLPVYAAADGYIYRVKIEPFGFGQAIYIRHTNGFVSLYAHLNAFYPALASWVKQKQYELERWDVSLELPPGLLNVKKGDLVAYSGNMGGSQGPHLHFEIRSFPDDVNLNPMLFGLPVPDNIPPVFRTLSVYDRNKSFYEQSPFFIPVKKSAGHYQIGPDELILKTGNPGFGIQGFDTQTGSKNPNGIFQAIIYEDGKAVSGFQMNQISYDETRGINAHIDYPTHKRGGPYFQLLFRMPGYTHSIYREANPGGYISLEDGKMHRIRIELKDAAGNSSTLEFKVRYIVQQQEKKMDNINHMFIKKAFYPGMLDGYEWPDGAFYIGEKCLYDSVNVNFAEGSGPGLMPDLVSSIFQIGDTKVPLADTMIIRIKLKEQLDKKDRVLVQWSQDGEFEVKKPEWKGDWATAAFRSFGTFSLVLDTLPPLIRFPDIVENANLRNSSRIAVVITDNNKRIKNFRATLDGNWILFSNDKEKAFIYHFDEHCKSGPHELKITAEDEAGNGASAMIHFIR